MLRKKLPFIILFFSIIATFIVRFTYVSLFISILSLISCIIFSKKDKRILLFTVIISIFTIVTDLIIIYKNNEIVVDKFSDTNILLGSWLYNNGNGKYIFNEDYSYIDYENSNDLGSYCFGTYEYSHGGTGTDGVVITHDENYYYYDLMMNNIGCINNGNEINYEDTKKFIFGIKKDNYDDLIFINSLDNYAYKAIKID